MAAGGEDTVTEGGGADDEGLAVVQIVNGAVCGLYPGRLAFH